jgi:hypothetical protein
MPELRKGREGEGREKVGTGSGAETPTYLVSLASAFQSYKRTYQYVMSHCIRLHMTQNLRSNTAWSERAASPHPLQGPPVHCFKFRQLNGCGELFSSDLRGRGGDPKRT